MARPKGNAEELERRRRLAVSRVVDDKVPPQAVAREQRVTQRSVDRWVATYHEGKSKALARKSHPGRTPKLTAKQEREVLSWIIQSPTQFGYPNELWTGARVAEQVFKHFKIKLNSRYMLQWLKRRGVSSQKPQRVPMERNEQEIQRWLREDWPRIQKKPVAKRPGST